MSASAGTVTLELDANSVKMVRELLKAQKATQRSARTMQNSMTTAFAAIKTAGMAAAAAFEVRNIVRAGLEMERLGNSFRAATGSVQAGAREMEFATHVAKNLGLDLASSAGAFASLTAAARGTALQGQAARDIFTAVSESMLVLGKTSDQTKGALLAIEQMISKGKVTAEELRGQLGERLPGAMQAMAKALGVTTAELDKMLQKGEIGIDALPKLAAELKKTYGPQVEGSINSAQAAMNRFNTAILELRNSVARSGVLDVLAKLATGIANVISPGLALDIQQTQTRLEALYQQLARERGNVGDAVTPTITTLKRTIEETERALDELLLKQGRLVSPEFDPVVLGPESTDTEAMDEYSKELESLRNRFASAEEKAEKLRATMAKFGGDLSAGQLREMQKELDDVLFSGLDEIEVQAYEVSDNLKKLWQVDMSESAKQAARNIQDAFADFLFDPFDKGIKGMLESFLTAIRRMLANQAAAKFFGEGSFFGSLFGRASGGPVNAGQTYMVGERGPELFTPGNSGMIIPNHKLAGAGGASFQYNIDARGADEATIIQKMTPLLERTIQISRDLVQKDLREGRL